VKLLWGCGGLGLSFIESSLCIWLYSVCRIECLYGDWGKLLYSLSYSVTYIFSFVAYGCFYVWLLLLIDWLLSFPSWVTSFMARLRSKIPSVSSLGSCEVDADLFLPAGRGARRRYLWCRHQVTDVFLEKLVVVVQLVVFFLDGFDAIKDLKEGGLQVFGVSRSSVLVRLHRRGRICRQLTRSTHLWHLCSSSLNPDCSFADSSLSHHPRRNAHPPYLTLLLDVPSAQWWSRCSFDSPSWVGRGADRCVLKMRTSSKSCLLWSGCVVVCVVVNP